MPRLPAGVAPFSVLRLAGLTVLAGLAPVLATAQNVTGLVRALRRQRLVQRLGGESRALRPRTQRPFEGNVIPPARLDPVTLRVVEELYPRANTPGRRVANGQTIALKVRF
jgi:hypothetical protein